jgi:hypothetical protein
MQIALAILIAEGDRVIMVTRERFTPKRLDAFFEGVEAVNDQMSIEMGPSRRDAALDPDICHDEGRPKKSAIQNPTREARMRIDKEVAQTCSFRAKGWCGSGAP